MQFTLELVDVNDNAPVFIQSHFEIYINENELNFPYGFRVEAFDRDLNGNSAQLRRNFGVFSDRHFKTTTNQKQICFFCFLVDSDNSRVRYSIIGGDLQSNFTIHRTTGELSVTHPLDFELLAPSIL